ncbi:hypothetical protein HanXRQr2_Chr10g0465841 [Helianthus annuus]|uniref:Hydroxyproline-rich glycoprotein family protein n=1 Tax=Helianthus annuus TaxID=4232 RepID=A0A251TRZ2_HELAN|nr:formin-like protein 14 [Helianthus annuus]KAF5788606.1 hypothetical protein HanXRQr2_Chr10g0465841 [Helianthus annuus]KAJ0698699.1 hypothetical protein HanLR1_Chr10g0382721 [Helianthus annuus]
MEPDPDSSPALWFQPPVTTTRRRSTPLIDPVFLIILIPVLALLFFFICIPPFLSHASHILNPKSTWDSLNMFLVLFAILCGLMSRKDEDDVTLTSSSASFVAEGSDHSSVGSDRKVMPYGYFDVETLRESENSNQNEEDDEVVNSDVKEIPVDTFVVTSNAAEQPHSFRSVGKDVKFNVPTKIESDDSNKVMISSYPPPPPPPPPMKLRSHHKHKTLERKVSDATKEIATAISSLYNHRKKKSKRPPPPPPSVLRNPFKRIYSVPATVPPPSSIFNNIFKSGNKSKRFLLPSPAPPSSSMIKTGTKSKRFNASSPPPLPPPRYTMSTGKPPLPTRTSSYNESGSQSPMPPPPPPFKVSDMKFEVRGDFVKIRSAHSSACSSPDHDIDDLVGGDLIGPGSRLICFPSPDVDAKADRFISRLKDEWKKEKINYVNEKLG